MLNNRYKNIIIIAHVLTTVPAEDLKEYLIRKDTDHVLFIGHPLFYSKGRRGSFYELFTKGKLVKTVVHKNRNIPSLISYAWDIVLTIFWVLKIGKKWDLIISLDNLNTLTALILKTMKRTKKVVYYTIDFTPHRFRNSFLNSLYHYIDKICVKYADRTWNLTDRMAKGREKVRNLSLSIYTKQRTVPIGIWCNRIHRKTFSEIKQHTMVYAGGLLPHQGIQIVIEAVPYIIKQIPDFRFMIIGMGSYDKELKEMVNKLKLNKYIHFLGYLEKHEDVEEILSQCGLAVAMYNKELDQWSYYADPSKIKSYLAAGLPVVTTSLTHIAKDIEKNECGMIVKYEKEKVAEAVISIIKNKRKYKIMRKNAITFAKRFDWNLIFSNALKEIEAV